MTSGAIQQGVPTKVFLMPRLSPLSINDDETPKSANSTDPSSSMSRLPALTSLFTVKDSPMSENRRPMHHRKGYVNISGGIVVLGSVESCVLVLCCCAFPMHPMHPHSNSPLSKVDLIWVCILFGRLQCGRSCRQTHFSAPMTQHALYPHAHMFGGMVYLPVDMPVFVEIVQSLQSLLQNGSNRDLIQAIRIRCLHDIQT